MHLAPASFRRLSSPDGVLVIRRLQEAGYETYFVGGCVRDMLLDRTPKDFDIATSAKPKELKKIFGSRCRIIGRRFQLVHLYCAGQMFEIATFRGPPNSQDFADDNSGFVVRANTFGSSLDDAKSRDFTVNGLFYDPIAQKVLDHVGGLGDLKNRQLHTIGDAVLRFKEDPVRILRAIKFASKLDFQLSEEVIVAAKECAHLIPSCPRARVTEEIYRLAESGYLSFAIPMMMELGVMETLIPEACSFLAPEAKERDYILAWLGELDRLRLAHGPLPRESIYALCSWPFIKGSLEKKLKEHSAHWGKIIQTDMRDLAIRMAIPTYHRHCLETMAEQLRRLQQSPTRVPPKRHLIRMGTRLALTAQRMHFNITGEGQKAYDAWARPLHAMGLDASPFPLRSEAEEMTSSRQNKNGPRRRRRDHRKTQS